MLFIFFLPYLILGALLVVFIIRSRKLNRQLAQQDSDRAELSLGAAIRTERQRCGMTQEELAEQLGVSRQAVSKWENDTAAPGSANLLSLAQLFGISVDELLKMSK
ncbi:MAG: helix-turn-helix transcriptional regulator [Firmicutes bacterium]|nr:helix-turn-helix transcriptional regulator [Bacillota bacterium]